MKLSRRQFLKSTLAASALVGAGGMGTLLTPRTAHAAANSPQLGKWIQPIRGLGPTGIPVLNWSPGPVVLKHDFLPGNRGRVHRSTPPGTRANNAVGLLRHDRYPVRPRHLGGVIITTRGHGGQDPLHKHPAPARTSSRWTRPFPARTRPRTGSPSTSTAASSPGSATAGRSTGGRRSTGSDSQVA